MGAFIHPISTSSCEKMFHHFTYFGVLWQHTPSHHGLDTTSGQLSPRSACRHQQVTSLDPPPFTAPLKPGDVIPHALKFLLYIVSSATVWYALDDPTFSDKFKGL